MAKKMAAQALRRVAPSLAFAGPALVVVAIAGGGFFIATAQGVFAAVGVIAAVAAAVCALVVAMRVALQDFASALLLRATVIVAGVALVVGGIWGVWIAAIGLVIYVGWSIVVGWRLIRTPAA
jgi:hypothetical protein